MDGIKLFEAGVALLGIIAEKGLPALVKWNDGTELTPEELDKLKVKKMSEKRTEG